MNRFLPATALILALAPVEAHATDLTCELDDTACNHLTYTFDDNTNGTMVEASFQKNAAINTFDVGARPIWISRRDDRSMHLFSRKEPGWELSYQNDNTETAMLVGKAKLTRDGRFAAGGQCSAPPPDDAGVNNDGTVGDLGVGASPSGHATVSYDVVIGPGRLQFYSDPDIRLAVP